MSRIASQQADNVQRLADIARKLEALPHSERSAFISAQADNLAVSKQTLYRWLREKTGWTSNRAIRKDKGESSLSDAALLVIGAMEKTATRKNGKRILPTTVATSIARQNGIVVPVSNSQVNRKLRQQRLSAKQQAQDAPHVRVRSLHPNHTHQVDPSLCVLYYMKGEQYLMESDKFYKNKLENYSKVKLKVWRYVLTDHASATIVVRYVEAAGENPGILADFLLWAWGQQSGRYFHGVPVNMIWDKGSANTAAGIKALLDSLEVKHIAHTAGNPRAKGSVENGNDIVETQFESRLKLTPVNRLRSSMRRRWPGAMPITATACRVRIPG